MQTMLAVVRQDVFERESVRVLRNALLTAKKIPVPMDLQLPVTRPGVRVRR
jgi:hypothetical protein